MLPDSPRLTYRKFTEDQYDDYIKWYTDTDVMRYITGRALTLVETRARFENALQNNLKRDDTGLYAAHSKTSDEFFGIAKFVISEPGEAEVGYGFLKDYWGKGYATEILRCLIDHGRKVSDVHRLLGIVDADNAASKKVLAKVGFQYIKTVTDGDSHAEYYRLHL